MLCQLVEKDAWILVSGYGPLPDLPKWRAQLMPASTSGLTDDPEGLQDALQLLLAIKVPF